MYASEVIEDKTADIFSRDTLCIVNAPLWLTVDDSVDDCIVYFA